MNRPTKPNGRETGISQANISRIPGFGLRNRIEPDPSPFYINSTDPDVKPDIPLIDRIQVDGDTPSPASSNKRSALGDSDDEVNKRVKASHDPPIPNSTSDRTSQYICHPDLETPRSTSSRPTAHNAETQTPMGNANTSPAPLARPAVPLIPIEGIETLQEASLDMIQALVRRDAVDREKQLMVAVGTMRTCLEIHFAPHMEVWREDIRAPVLQDDRSDAGLTTSGPSIGTLTGSRGTDGDNLSGSSRDTLRDELVGAQATVQRQEVTIAETNDQMARSKEENKRLGIQLAKARTQIEALTKATLPPKSDLVNTITALNKTIIEKQGEIERQKKGLQELESRNAKLVRESIITPPPTPIVPQVEPQVTALERTIQEQEGRIDRQKIQLFNLEKQNTKLKKDAMDKRSQQNASKPGQVGVGQGQARRARGEAGRRQAEVASGEKSGKSDGQSQRQLPPHMSGTRNGCVDASSNPGVESNVIRWEDIPSLYGSAGKQEDRAVGPSTGPKPGRHGKVASESRTGASRVPINTRSLLDRMCRQRSEDEQEVGRERDSTEGQSTDRGGVWDYEPTEDRFPASRGDHYESLEPDDVWGPGNSGEDQWGYPDISHEGAGQMNTGEDIYVNAIPGEDDWDHSQPSSDHWGHEDGGEHWDHYHAQSAQFEPGSNTTSW